MGRKPKFRPRITRVRLNPEQAVLTCTCYLSGSQITGGGMDTAVHGEGASCRGRTSGWCLDISEPGDDCETGGATSS